ncbi:DUF445 family protein [Methylophaga sp. OBS3]|uniref:DUF445 family protein n=1 Tax=Methylophaga sp. OBS3 TaxID=2991934 RepID=UPI00225B3CE9|nr:DUF445 family protein [Methylophaga sp. OBS3]MCX4189215.1 DUF445 domain-containing protein [Methylophaga sp. OBS3]
MDERLSRMNKGLLTNLIAGAIVGVGLILPTPWREPILSTGLFALAGGLTNWLAIHMLFEKVPGLYGSGVIAAKFTAFREAIENLVMQQFFSPTQIHRFIDDLHQQESKQLNLEAIIDSADLTPAWQSLVDTIKASSFGSMLAMFGGEKALEPLKEPFISKMQAAMNDIAHSDDFQQRLKAQVGGDNTADTLHQQIAQIVHQRLDELTPDMVKDIIQQMIRQHLGWLVIWGGVFGGVLGLFASFIPV